MSRMPPSEKSWYNGIIAALVTLLAVAVGVIAWLSYEYVKAHKKPAPKPKPKPDMSCAKLDTVNKCEGSGCTTLECPVPMPVDSKTLEMVFRDDFSDPAISSKNWAPQEFADSNATNSCSMYTKDNIHFVPGAMEIVVGKACTDPDVCITSGRVLSNKSWDHGFFTIKALVPKNLPQLWPALWLLGDDWPSQGELDIMETRGMETGFTSTVHCGGAPNPCACKDGKCSGAKGCCAMYGACWEKSAQPGVPSWANGDSNYSPKEGISWWNVPHVWGCLVDDSGTYFYMDAEVNGNGKIVDIKTQQPSKPYICVGKQACYPNCQPFQNLKFIFNLAIKSDQCSWDNNCSKCLDAIGTKLKILETRVYQ